MEVKTVYILVKDGQIDNPIKYGSKTEICNEWCQKRYRDAPDENFSVFEARILPVNKLFKDEIETTVEEYYK